MAESDFQREPLIYAVESLNIFFAGRADVYVSGNMFVYYRQGDPEAVVAPGVFVALGVAKHKRNSYRVWEEGKAPDFVLEITSNATYDKDQGAKVGIYSLMKVREYFQYDPTRDYLQPPLQGLRLAGRGYEPLPPKTLPDGALAIYSEVLGLELRLLAENGELRLFDPAAQSLLRSHAEAEAYAVEQAAARRLAESRADQEAAARRAAEEEAARLRAELERLKGKTQS
jgi:Uma2 family endonuclease